ncbi:hypothetical protein NMG60_11017366 [Bertholletia excelsa]
MRRSLEKFSDPTIGNATKHALIPSCSAFSTSAGGGGRGRGRGSTRFQFTNPEEDDDTSKTDDPSPFPSGLGHGRGKPLPSSPSLPSFSSFMSAIRSGSSGTGRGQAPPIPQSEQFKTPIFFSKERVNDEPTAPKVSGLGKTPQNSDLPSGILSVLTGGGRGKPTRESSPTEKPKEENRHLGARQPRTRQPSTGRYVAQSSSSSTPKMSAEEARKKGLEILSRRGGVEDRAMDGGGGRGGFEDRAMEGGRSIGGFRGRGTKGRGGKGRRARGRGERYREQMDRVEDVEDEYATEHYLGDNAGGEKFAKRVGPENMNKLTEAFEEMSSRVLPSPLDDAYVDAIDMNLKIECEPEYLMEEFGTNPDIDEKPPIPLRDALEKMKPFLMAYEGIQSQEEWEEAMKETMANVPLMKQIVDYYSGPDRVTAKKQQEELERVANTLPENAPASVKRFTENAVLSLQSNPGWGFDKKYQFMDKLVREVSQHYKNA